MKVCICYKSAHHLNTLKLIETIKDQNELDLVDVTKEPNTHKMPSIMGIF